MRLIVVLLVALVSAPGALASEARPTQAELEGELVCPTCKTTLDQSNAPIAVRMKAFVRERIAAGDSKSEIKDQLVAQFGKGVLAAPEREGFDLLAWVLPIAGLLVAAGGVTLLLWRWTRRTDEELPLLEGSVREVVAVDGTRHVPRGKDAGSVNM